MIEFIDTSVTAWWKERLQKGISAESNPDTSIEVRYDRHWCRLVAEDTSYLSYRAFCRKEKIPPLARSVFEPIYEKLLGTFEYSCFPLPRKDMVSGEWTKCGYTYRGVKPRIIRSLEECRAEYEKVLGEKQDWPLIEDAQRSWQEMLPDTIQNVSFHLWWWWKLRRGETTCYHGNSNLIEWNRQPVLEDLYESYEAFCERHRLSRAIETNRLGTNTLQKDMHYADFSYVLRKVLPGDYLIPMMLTFRLPAHKRNRSKRHLGDLIDVFESVFLPDLESCRRTFEEKSGIPPQEWEWEDIQEEILDEEPDMASVAAWWHWKLLEGVTVPDETSPYGYEDLFWNRFPSRKLLFTSYRHFCRKQNRSALSKSEFFNVFCGLAPTYSTYVPLFHQDNSEARLELLRCMMLPELDQCRTIFVLSVGMDVVDWEKEENRTRRLCKITELEPLKVFRLWWHRLLCRAAVYNHSDESEKDEIPNSWPLISSRKRLTKTYRLFCSQRGVNPVDDETLYAWTLAVLPKEPSQDEHHTTSDAPTSNPLACYTLEECRKSFEKCIEKQMVWPPFCPPGLQSISNRDIYWEETEGYMDDEYYEKNPF